MALARYCNETGSCRCSSQQLLLSGCLLLVGFPSPVPISPWIRLAEIYCPVDVDTSLIYCSAPPLDHRPVDTTKPSSTNRLLPTVVPSYTTSRLGQSASAPLRRLYQSACACNSNWPHQFALCTSKQPDRLTSYSQLTRPCHGSATQ